MVATATAVKKPRKKAKPKVKNTLLSVLLDRSGSMSVATQATIEGFNTFVKDQSKEEGIGKLLMTLVQFDDQYEVNFTAEDSKDIPSLDRESYIPRGMTALNDSLVKSIRDTEIWAKQNKYSDDVIFLIITDGAENASKEATLDHVAELIRQKEKDGWSFVFMGANIDAFATAGRYNIPVGNVAGYNQDNMAATFTAASTGLTAHRTSGGYAGQSGIYMAAVANSSPDVHTSFDASSASSLPLVSGFDLTAADEGKLKIKKKK